MISVLTYGTAFSYCWFLLNNVWIMCCLIHYSANRVVITVTCVVEALIQERVLIKDQTWEHPICLEIHRCWSSEHQMGGWWLWGCHLEPVSVKLMGAFLGCWKPNHIFFLYGKCGNWLRLLHPHPKIVLAIAATLHPASNALPWQFREHPKFLTEPCEEKSYLQGCDWTPQSLVSVADVSSIGVF